MIPREFIYGIAILAWMYVMFRVMSFNPGNLETGERRVYGCLAFFTMFALSIVIYFFTVAAARWAS